MTVSAQTPLNKYVASGTTTVFPYSFRILEEEDLVVFLDGIAQASGFTVSGVGNEAGGAVTFLAPPPVDVDVTIQRAVSITRTTDYVEGGPLRAQTMDDDLDRIVMMIQDSDLVVANALRLPPGDAASGLLPKAEMRALKTLAFDSFGNPVMSAAAGNADVLAATLLSAGDASTGGGIVGYNPEASYAEGTVGAQLTAFDEHLADAISGAPVVVNSVAALRLRSKLVNTHVITLGYYTPGDGGSNTFYLDSADSTSADNGGQCIVAADGGRWKSVSRYKFSPLQWGAKGDNVQDDQPFFQNAVNYVSSFSVPVAGANAGALVEHDERKIYRFSNALNLNVPLTLRVHGTINFIPTSGTAIRVGTSATWNNGYDIFIRNMIGAGGGSPTNVNFSGSRALLITSMAFSKVEVRSIQGFSLAAIDLQGYGDFGYQQVVQHNRFIFGQIVNNGYGMRTKSLHPATSSVQANEFTIQNIYQNAGNFLIDDVGAGATNSNTFRINAMDNVSAGSVIGIGLDMWGSLNDFWIGFSGTPGTTLKLRDTAYGNTFRFGNTPETDIIIDYGTVAKNNRVICAPPSQSQLPAVGIAAPASGANVQNTYGVPVMIYMRVDMDSTGSFEVYVGPDVGHLHKINTTPALAGVRYLPFSFRVPAGGYWKVFTTANNVTFQPYSVQDAS